ncbi:MAG: cupin domain-containing protein [Clostridiales bacterium]|nr:cupin domain-containing protein [Clostridiales bacterium]
MEENKYVGKIQDLPDAKGNFIKHATKKIVFGPKHFSDEFVMRCWTLEPGAGEKDQHQHNWPHWCVMLSGEGFFVIDGVEYPIEHGLWIYVPNKVPHRFYNSSETEKLELLCIVPPKGDIDPTLMGC